MSKPRKHVVTLKVFVEVEGPETMEEARQEARRCLESIVLKKHSVPISDELVGMRAIGVDIFYNHSDEEMES